MKTPYKTAITAFSGALLAVLSMSADGAQAQSSSPSSTTANYGDWVVRCRAPESAPDQPTDSASNVCEMVTIIRIQTPESQDANGRVIPAQSRVLSQVALGRLPETEDVKAVIQVPAGVWLRDPLLLALGEDEAALDTADKLSASYFRCIADFCLADIDLNAANLSALQQAKVARMSFVDGARRTINVPISMNGFSGALSALGVN